MVEVDKLRKEDNELEVYEIICLRLEPKEFLALRGWYCMVQEQR